MKEGDHSIPPLVSIIIVNWNGMKWLKLCLDSLVAQEYKRYEIILVDNASSDDSVSFVKINYPNVRLVIAEENLGFAGGNNLGYQHTQGEYIVLLNNDTWVEPIFLASFLEAFSEIPNLGCVQSKIVLMDSPDSLDLVGSYWTTSTFLYYYGYGKDKDLEGYNQPMPFFSVKGASILLSRRIIDEVGLFDNDFWCYYEETDLCHRLWLAGYECWYYPKAIAHHAVGGTSLSIDNDFVQFHNFKNKLLSFLKNFEISTLLVVLPIYIGVNIILSIYWLLSNKTGNSVALYRSMGWNIRHLSETLRKRQEIQKFRKCKDKHIFGIVKKNPRISYYFRLLNGTLALYED